MASNVSSEFSNVTDMDIYSVCNLSDTDIVTFSKVSTFTVVVYRNIIPSLCLVGILGNILNLMVLTHKSWEHMGRLQAFAKTGLVALATADMGVCVSAIPWWFVFHREPIDSTSLSFRIIYIAYSSFLINTFMLTSTLFTVTLAVGRYLAIRWPIEMRAWINKTFTRTMIISVIVISVLFNLPHLWRRKIHKCTEKDITYYYVRYGFFHKGKPHLIYSCVYFVTAVAIPIVILAFCNIFLIKSINRSQKYQLQYTPSAKSMHKGSSESKHFSTRVLASIVLMHILLVTPGRLTGFMMQILKVAQNSSGYFVVVTVVNVLEVCNYAFNFVLYCTLNSHFRLVIRRALMRCCNLCRHEEPTHYHPTPCHPPEDVNLVSYTAQQK